MRKAAVIFAVLLSFSLSVRGQLASSTEAALKDKLDKYATAMSFAPVKAQCEESDLIINSCKDSLVRQFTACYLHSLFMESKVMGAECVAVHIFDKWFSDGNVKFKDEASYLAANLHASLNRPTLLDCKAPSLLLKDSSLNDFILEAGHDRVSLLLFFDAECPKCRLESLMTSRILNEENWPVDFYAIYIGEDKNKWEEFREQNLKVSAGNTKAYDLWDPEGTSDMAGIYGLIQTPKIFICDEDGIIIGRNLDSQAVSAILSEHFTFYEMNYGSEESKTLFDNILPSDDSQGIKDIADYIAKSSLEKGGRDMYRQMTGDLLYYLSSKPGAACVSACDYVIDNYIYGNRAWANPGDSLKIIGLADMLKGLHSRNEVGEKIPDIEIWGKYLKSDGSAAKARKYRLGKLKKNETALLFYTETCQDCAKMLKEAASWVRKGRKVLLIQMGEAERMMPEDNFTIMMDSFDLSSLPHLLTVSADGTVTGNYLDSLPF